MKLRINRVQINHAFQTWNDKNLAKTWSKLRIKWHFELTVFELAMPKLYFSWLLHLHSVLEGLSSEVIITKKMTSVFSPKSFESSNYDTIILLPKKRDLTRETRSHKPLPLNYKYHKPFTLQIFELFFCRWIYFHTLRKHQKRAIFGWSLSKFYNGCLFLKVF